MLLHCSDTIIDSHIYLARFVIIFVLAMITRTNLLLSGSLINRSGRHWSLFLMGLPKCTVDSILVCFRPPKTDLSKSLSTSTLIPPQVQSPGQSLPLTAAQSVCTIATDGNQSTPSVTIYSSQKLPYGHIGTLDNAC